jgi:hypothetical protein
MIFCYNELMLEYEIKCVKKDGEGVIQDIGFERDGSVYLISRAIAVSKIKNGSASYYIYNEQKTKVQVYADDFLRSTADSSTYNNLDNLRNCKNY